MAKTCGDCVFCGAKNGMRWDNPEYCTKHGHAVSYDDIACGYFREDSDGCCYDCDYFKSGIFGGKCTYNNQSISAPANHTCSHNTY